MKAITVTTTTEAPTPLSVCLHHFLVANSAQTTTQESSAAINQREHSICATTATMTLSPDLSEALGETVVLDEDYRHFGIND